jgi:hypothetical protein
LRRATLSITNDLASRLHQAITPGSERCYPVVYASLPHMQPFFPFFLQNSSNTSSPEKNPEKARRNRLFGKQRDPRRGIIAHTYVSGWAPHMINNRFYRDEEALFGRAGRLINPLSRNEEEPVFDGCFSLTLAEQAALRPLESLPPEPCPQELAERTVRCLCAMAQGAQPPAPIQTPRLRSHDLEDFWLCLSSNILMM